jgi:hypothetical protein
MKGPLWLFFMKRSKTARNGEINAKKVIKNEKNLSKLKNT